ncbi:MAG: 50S ribosomal protein L30 [Clostridia bacterium]|nr:50S ribosomal protein L30 [Oscillospiraceae bacterium]MBO7162271.1 50S ribosomal protein L30 [Clostridia bacterium]MBQ3599558.1 50S ribosomal protein L30 [Clostridia bacterium]MBR2914870.1 50S ribosomal protein L30 [Clostridia bacterium]MBR3845075.1 50S ribosomal protein L30 [Clostridia bacterium]
MAKVKITLTRSLIGHKKNQILTAKSLGLNKIGDFKVAERNPLIDGKINVISHLISVEDAE